MDEITPSVPLSNSRLRVREILCVSLSSAITNVTTKLCDDFILVCGDTPANEDLAVDIVNDYIAKHRQTCICSYL